MKKLIPALLLVSAVLLGTAPAFADLVADETESDQATVATTNTGNTRTAFLIESTVLCPDAITSAGTGTVAGYRCRTNGFFALDFTRCMRGCN